MKYKLIIKNGLIVDPARSIESRGDVIMEDGIIVGSGPGATAAESEGARVIDADGMVVTPGFIDMHCHLREPGFEEKETIKTGSMAAA
ncbi:MAG: amidohydrolase family protein, partial [Dehalococcoidales bacterium]